MRVWRWAVPTVFAIVPFSCAELRSADSGLDAGAADAAGDEEGEGNDGGTSEDASVDQKSTKDGAKDSALGDVSAQDGSVRVVEVLASGLTQPLELVLSDGTLFFTQQADQTAQVRKVQIDGGGLGILGPYDASGQNPNANDLAVVGSDVFWANGTAAAGRIFAVPKTGGTVRNVGGLIDTPYRMTAYGSDLYYVDRALSPDTYALQRMPNTGGATSLIAEYQIRVGGIAVDPSGVYWTHGGPLANGKNGLRKNVHGGGPDASVDLHVGSTNTEVGGLALGTNDVFWAEAAAGRILRIGKTGGLLTVLADSLAAPLRLVLDGGYVYFTEHGGGSAADGTIRRVPTSGGTVETLADSQDHPVGIAVDATHVYWTNYGNGEVARVAK